MNMELMKFFYLLSFTSRKLRVFSISFLLLERKAKIFLRENMICSHRPDMNVKDIKFLSFANTSSVFYESFMGLVCLSNNLILFYQRFLLGH
jgi:hypothetical protein